MTDLSEDDRRLERDVVVIRGAACTACGSMLCGHLAVVNVMIGLSDAPRCLKCLAREMGRAAAEIRDDVWAHVSQRDCYRRAWQDESEREHFARESLPACLWPTEQTASIRRDVALNEPSATTAADATWNAGDLGCGDLVLALRGKLRALPPGGVLRVTAIDPAAPEDLPAWCRLTGNRLLRSSHPNYDIQRKGG